MRGSLIHGLGCGVIAMAVAATVSPAKADSITPGQTISISGTTEAANPYLAGTVLQDASVPFSVTNTSTGGLVSGTFRNRVVQETGTGTLDFYYLVSLGDGSAPQIGAVRTSGFAGVTTDVNYRTDGIGSVGPTEVTDFASPLGDLDFSFGTPVEPDESSYFMYIHTNATTYSLSAFTDLSVDFGAGDQGFTAPIATFAPGSAPLPKTWSAALALLGFAGLGQLLRKRFPNLLTN